MTFPDKPTSPSQRFVTAGYESGMITKEAILEFCRQPCRKGKIAEHFGVTKFQILALMDALIADGKLFADDNPNDAWRKFVTAASESEATRDEQLKRFCAEPRTRRQIAEFLGLAPNRTNIIFAEQVDAGNLKLQHPEKSTRHNQKFVAAGIDALTLSADEVARFCEIPRTRKEIADRFGLEQRAARSYIFEYIESGKLARTMPDKPISRMQKYIKAQ
jgi:predicted ArsR family transcriptional regulator